MVNRLAMILKDSTNFIVYQIVTESYLWLKACSISELIVFPEIPTQGCLIYENFHNGL